MKKKKLFFILAILGVITSYLAAMEVGEPEEEIGYYEQETPDLIRLSEEQMQSHFKLNDEQFEEALELVESAIKKYPTPKADQWTINKYNADQLKPLFTLLNPTVADVTNDQIKSDSALFQFIKWYAHNNKRLPDWMNSVTYFYYPSKLDQDYSTYYDKSDYLKVFKEILQFEGEKYRKEDRLKREKEGGERPEHL